MIGLKSWVDNLCLIVVTGEDISTEGVVISGVVKFTVTFSMRVTLGVTSSGLVRFAVAVEKLDSFSVVNGVPVVVTQTPLWSSLRDFPRQTALENSQIFG